MTTMALLLPLAAFTRAGEKIPAKIKGGWLVIMTGWHDAINWSKMSREVGGTGGMVAWHRLHMTGQGIAPGKRIL
jgi:hypothetical protein